MYKRLAAELKQTRKSFTETCHFLGLDPQLMEPDKLKLSHCDNCGYWELPSKAVVDPSDGTILCYACDELETLRF